MPLHEEGVIVMRIYRGNKRSICFRNKKRNQKNVPGCGVILLLLVSILALSACQKTPDEEYVHGKDSKILEEAIQKTSEEVTAPKEYEEIVEPIFEDYSYKDEFVGAEDNVLIQVDAGGRWQTDQIPVIRVKPYSIVPEDVRRWGEVLTGSDTFYEPKVEMTKREIEELLLEWKQLYEDEDALLDFYLGYAADAARAKDEYLAYKAELEKLYPDAPETELKRETDWTFHESSYYERKDMFPLILEDVPELDEKLIVEAETEDGHARITASNYQNGAYQRHSLYYEIHNYQRDAWNYQWDVSGERPMKLSEQEVLQMVEEKLDALGLTHVELSSYVMYGKSENESGSRRNKIASADSEDVYQYQLYYYPSYQGLSPLQKGGYVPNQEQPMGAVYDFESVAVQVANDTIQILQWNGPLEVVGIEQQDVEVLSFDEICKRFREQMQIEYTEGKISRYSPENDDYEEELERIKGGEIHIDKILFGLIRIQIPNNYDEFRMVPAWSFRGEELLDWGDGIDWEGYYAGEYRREQIYQTINAVDGTFINWRMGY